MENPFTTIDERLSKIESMLNQLVEQKQPEIEQRKQLIEKQQVEQKVSLQNSSLNKKYKNLASVLIGLVAMHQLEKNRNNPYNLSSDYTSSVICGVTSFLCCEILKKYGNISEDIKTSEKMSLTSKSIIEQFYQNSH